MMIFLAWKSLCFYVYALKYFLMKYIDWNLLVSNAAQEQLAWIPNEAKLNVEL